MASGEGSEDAELARIRLRRLKELQARARAREEARAAPPKPPEESPRGLVLKYLDEKAREVLEAAEAQYPSEAGAVLGMLANLVRRGYVKDVVDGPTLFHLFRRLGIPVRLKTSIVYYEHGKVKSLEEKLREAEET